MKKAIAMLAAVALLLGFTSCGDDAVLGKSAAKKAIKKEALFAKDFATAKFDTGFYEIDEDYVLKLAQLQAAGVITYKVETVIEKVQKRNYNYWSGYSYYTVDNEHLFATVALTEQGRKYVVENPTRLRKDIADDFKANKDYEEAVPDYMNADPAAPVQAVPAAEEEVEVVAVEADSVAADSVVVMAEEVEEVVEEAPAAPANPNAAYEAACAKVSRESHEMLLGRFELEKVKEVRCSEDMAKNGVGQCTLLYTFRDKTPFGYVLGAPRQGFIEEATVSFIYYEDMGWTVDNLKNK